MRLVRINSATLQVLQTRSSLLVGIERASERATNIINDGLEMMVVVVVVVVGGLVALYVVSVLLAVYSVARLVGLYML